MSPTLNRFAATLVEWQRHHGRHDLPWQTRDAYRVWICRRVDIARHWIAHHPFSPRG